MNNDFVLYHSERSAARLEELGATPEERTCAAFRLAFQREPTPEERADFTAYAARSGLAAMCRLLLNSSEFFFIN